MSFVPFVAKTCDVVVHRKLKGKSQKALRGELSMDFTEALPRRPLFLRPQVAKIRQIGQVNDAAGRIQ